MYRYTVTGRGTFPDDMLRYDRAVTISGQVSDPNKNRKPGDPWSPGEIREVVVLGDRKPTVARWNSFGWGVMEVSSV